MASPLVLLPLLAANLASPGVVREIRGAGLVVRTAAYARDGRTEGEIDVRGPGIAQRIRLRRDVTIGPHMLIASVRIVDANFDGHPDIVMLRDWGATYGMLDVFLYDATTRRFTNASALARALSHLANADIVPAHHAITTHDLGPSNPSSTTYAIDAGRLRIVESCRFLNGMSDRSGTLVLTRGAHSTYTHLRLAPGDVAPCQ
jgi:hypothetical protein